MPELGEKERIEVEEDRMDVVKSSRNGNSRGICFPKEIREGDDFPTREGTHYELYRTERGIEVVPV